MRAQQGSIEAKMQDERTPAELRDGVRSGILTSIKRDVDLRGPRTARLLLAAGVAGVVGALGVTLLVSTHPFGHHPSWHMVVFSAVWVGLLVVSFAMAFLDVRTPSLHLARAASVGLLGLGIAGICGALCPDQHFLHWWAGTGIGGFLSRSGGLALSALCFGVVTTFAVGLLSSFLMLAVPDQAGSSPLLPAAVLLVLLAPGVALQSFGTSVGVFGAWLGGVALGAYVGVVGGLRLRALLSGRGTA